MTDLTYIQISDILRGLLQRRNELQTAKLLAIHTHDFHELDRTEIRIATLNADIADYTARLLSLDPDNEIPFFTVGNRVKATATLVTESGRIPTDSVGTVIRHPKTHMLTVAWDDFNQAPLRARLYADLATENAFGGRWVNVIDHVALLPEPTITSDHRAKPVTDYDRIAPGSLLPDAE